MANVLTLKWGTVKSWSIETDAARDAMQRWADHGVCMSAACHKDTPEQVECLLSAIDLMDEIWLDWTGVKVSKEEAKQYVLDYHKDEQS